MSTAAHNQPEKDLDRQLLDQIRRQAGALNLPRLVEWLADVIDGHVVLTASDGFRLASSSPAADAALAPAAQDVARVASGDRKAVAVDEGSAKVRLFAIGHASPHAVLATARTEPYSEQATRAIAHVADLLALLLPVAKLDSALFRVRGAATEVHKAILNLLMSGQPASARRVAADLAPGALADIVRLYIVDCTTGDRLETAEAISEAIKNGAPPKGVTVPRADTALVEGALVAPCPAIDSHLIVVAPTHHGSASGRSADTVGAALRSVVADSPGHYLGASEATDLAHATDAYRDADRALCAARQVPERAWQYNGDAELTAVIDPEQAHAWAETFLQPLIHAPHAERDHLFTTIRHTLALRVAEVASALDVHRNTVHKRCDKVADLLQLDLDDVSACAVLNLALQIDATSTAGPPRKRAEGDVTLPQVLGTSSAHTWQEALLAQLDQDDRDLRRTLRAWLTHNADANCAAQELGIHPQTVRTHLRRAEGLLQRPLLAGASGRYDVMLALFIAGELPATTSVRGCSHNAFLDRYRDRDAGQRR